MLTCIVTGSEKGNLVKLTLDHLIKCNPAFIIVATNRPCTQEICEIYSSTKIFFTKTRFSNKCAARSFALQLVSLGRVLFLDSGAVPTVSSVTIHSNAAATEIICGLYTRKFDFNFNFQTDINVTELYQVKDFRLLLSDRDRTPWVLWANNNISIDVSAVRLAGGEDPYFYVEGVTENAVIAYKLHNLNYHFKLSEQAQIESYTLLEELQLQPDKLRTLYIWFTDRCNYHCRICRLGQKAYSAGSYKEPTLEKIQELIYQASNIGISKIELFGGEMLIRDDLFTVIETCNANSMEVGFVSNGSLITESISKKIFHLKLIDIPISVDAPIAALNDSIRGANAWDKTMRGIDNLKKYYNTFSIFSVVMKQNFQYMSDMVRLAKQLGATSISFQPVSSRQCGKDYADFCLDYSDIPKLKQAISNALELAEQIGIPIRNTMMVKTIPEYVLRGEQLVMEKGCTIPMKEALISKTGKTQLCFSSFGPEQWYQKSDGTNLASVWKSPMYQKLKQLALTGQCPGCLANCSDLGYLFNEAHNFAADSGTGSLS
ncbi:radical SAM protein [Lacrimispora brassicae]